MNKRTRNIVIVVVTAVWATSFLCALFVEGYEPAESVNAVFAAVVAGAVAVSRNGNGGGDE